MSGIREYEDTFASFKTPVLIIQGAKDNSVDPQGAIDLYEQCGSENKTIMLYPNLWHNIWQEEEIYEIMPKVCDWLDTFK